MQPVIVARVVSESLGEGRGEGQKKRRTGVEGVQAESPFAFTFAGATGANLVCDGKEERGGEGRQGVSGRRG